MVNLQCDKVGCFVAAIVGLVSKIIGIHALDCRSLVRGASAGSSGFKAWCGASSREACASRQVCLSIRCAVQAALLAPTKEACSLAVLDTIICSLSVALRTRAANADCCCQAIIELAMVNLQCDKVGCFVAAIVGLVSKIIGIHALDCRGLVRGASAGGSGFKAWCGASSREACASRQVCLSIRCAVQAALLAPTKEACSLAVLDTIICSL